MVFYFGRFQQLVSYCSSFLLAILQSTCISSFGNVEGFYIVLNSSSLSYIINVYSLKGISLGSQLTVTMFLKSAF